MKRVFTITLTVALFGGLMLMGFGGTAAAQEIGVEVGTGDTGDVNQSADQEAEINQENNNTQVGVAEASATSSASAAVDQAQDVQQENNASIEQEIDQEGESGDSGVSVELELLADILSA